MKEVKNTQLKSNKPEIPPGQAKKIPLEDSQCSKKNKRKKVLFLLKKRNNYGQNGVSYGLKVSCEMVAECLKEWADSKISIIIDSNSIDREVYLYKPDFAVIEAIYVPPYKMEELLNLHKKVQFTIRLHSKFPFLAQERMAMEWIVEYNKLAEKYKNFTISSNNEKFTDEINSTLGYDVKLTPNCYPIDNSLRPNTDCIHDVLSIGCFGALRTLKNHLEQAVCAIYVANKLGKKLHFHINDSSTYEKEGTPILNNLVHLFDDTFHRLYINKWHGHSDFIDLVKRMDVGMQVSFSESYNLVCADFVSNGIPIIGSSEIEFLSRQYQAEPTNFNDITSKLLFAIKMKPFGFHMVNEIFLRRQTKDAINHWLDFLDIKK